jgi:hypothetical protein
MVIIIMISTVLLISYMRCNMRTTTAEGASQKQDGMLDAWVVTG